MPQHWMGTRLSSTRVGQKSEGATRQRGGGGDESLVPDSLLCLVRTFQLHVIRLVPLLTCCISHATRKVLVEICFCQFQRNTENILEKGR